MADMNRPVTAALAVTALITIAIAGPPQGSTITAGQAHPITTVRRPAVPASPTPIDDTHPAPTPRIVIHAERPSEVEVAARGLAKFEQAGLALPDLVIHFPADRTGCGDAFGRYQPHDNQPDLVQVCSPSEATLLHELGHAWAQHHLTRAQQASFLQIRDLQYWTGNHIAWHVRGSEHAASVIAWGLWNSPQARTMTITTDDTNATLLGAFVLLTGRQPLHTRSRGMPTANTLGAVPMTDPPEAASSPPTADQANPASPVAAHHDQSGSPDDRPEHPHLFDVARPAETSRSAPRRGRSLVSRTNAPGNCALGAASRRSSHEPNPRRLPDTRFDERCSLRWRRASCVGVTLTGSRRRWQWWLRHSIEPKASRKTQFHGAR